MGRDALMPLVPRLRSTELIPWRRAPRGGIFVKDVPIDRYIFLKLGRYVFFGEDRRHGALGLAGPTINALVRMYVKHFRTFVDTIDWTNVHAGLVLGIDTGLSNDVRHIVLV